MSESEKIGDAVSFAKFSRNHPRGDFFLPAQFGTN